MNKRSSNHDAAPVSDLNNNQNRYRRLGAALEGGDQDQPMVRKYGRKVGKADAEEVDQGDQAEPRTQIEGSNREKPEIRQMEVQKLKQE